MLSSDVNAHIIFLCLNSLLNEVIITLFLCWRKEEFTVAALTSEANVLQGMLPWWWSWGAWQTGGPAGSHPCLSLSPHLGSIQWKLKLKKPGELWGPRLHPRVQDREAPPSPRTWVESAEMFLRGEGTHLPFILGKAKLMTTWTQRSLLAMFAGSTWHFDVVQQHLCSSFLTKVYDLSTALRETEGFQSFWINQLLKGKRKISEDGCQL